MAINPVLLILKVCAHVFSCVNPSQLWNYFQENVAVSINIHDEQMVAWAILKISCFMPFLQFLDTLANWLWSFFTVPVFKPKYISTAFCFVSGDFKGSTYFHWLFYWYIAYFQKYECIHWLNLLKHTMLNDNAYFGNILRILRVHN